MEHTVVLYIIDVAAAAAWCIAVWSSVKARMSWRIDLFPPAYVTRGLFYADSKIYLRSDQWCMVYALLFLHRCSWYHRCSVRRRRRRWDEMGWMLWSSRLQVLMCRGSAGLMAPGRLQGPPPFWHVLLQFNPYIMPGSILLVHAIYTAYLLISWRPPFLFTYFSSNSTVGEVA